MQRPSYAVKFLFPFGLVQFMHFFRVFSQLCRNKNTFYTQPVMLHKKAYRNPMKIPVFAVENPLPLCYDKQV